MKAATSLRNALALLCATLLLVAASGAAGRAQEPAPAPAPVQPLTFRTLLIIKPVGDIHSDRYLKVQYQMTPRDIEAITASFRDYVPFWIDKMTHGRLRWQADVRVSTRPLRTIKTWDNGCAVVPEDIGQDVDEFAPQGKYDSIFVYWKSWDEQTGYRLPGPYGWAIGLPESSNFAGFASVQYDVPASWGRDSGSTECFIHEWMHQLESFYGSRAGVRLPRGGVHGGEEHGYTLNERNWKDWQADHLNGQVKEDGALVGLGEAAWRYGLMRDEAARKLAARTRLAPPVVSEAILQRDTDFADPKYLTPERKARNLLRNASFALGNDGSWETQTWKGNKLAAALRDDVPQPGQASVELSTTEPDDIKLLQKVAVKPRTNYLLSGWVATRGVRIVEVGGEVGATLGWFDHAERSPSLAGDNGLQYVATAFYSGDSSEVQVCARLGGIASTATGSALFHDLCLISVDD